MRSTGTATSFEIFYVLRVLLKRDTLWAFMRVLLPPSVLKGRENRI